MRKAGTIFINAESAGKERPTMRKMNKRRKERIEKNILRNRTYKVLIYNRFILTLLLVLLQIVVYALMLVHFYNGFRAVMITTELLGLLFVLYVINRNEKPSSKLNWVIMILAVPVFGVPMYMLFGEGRPTRRMHKRISAAKKENAACLARKTGVNPEKRDEEICRYLTRYADYPLFRDGEVTYYPSGKEMFKDMLAALDRAEKFILAEYFIVAGGKMWDEFRERLLQKARQGVQIRLIYDDVGSLLVLPPKYDRYLEYLHPNIKCFRFNPAVPVFTMRMNNRDHRKILVVDGKVAFTGGINLADEYIDEKVRFGVWKDTGVRVTGSAVDSFTVMFFNLWNAFRKDKEKTSDFLSGAPSGEGAEGDAGAGAQTDLPATGDLSGPGIRPAPVIQPYDDSPLDRESVGETVYLDIINRARDYVYIFTPYLILDDFMRAAICNAAKRGVDVRIVTPGIPDKKTVFRLTRSNYAPLLKSGVKIYEYTPGFIHAKSMVSDDLCAVVGTINLDYRSLYLHFENAVYFSGCPAVLDVKKDGENVFAVSRPISIENTRQGFIGRLTNSVLRVFETLV